MPRLPPVTTATAPCKFKNASLSLSGFAFEKQFIAVPDPDQTMCATHLGLALPPEPSGVHLFGVARFWIETLQSKVERPNVLTFTHTYIYTAYISRRKRAL